VTERPDEGARGIEGARPDQGTRPYGILIVDDEEAILESLEMTLSGDYRVFTATDGRAGLEILDEEKDIALVIVDQVMPRMTGVELRSSARSTTGASTATSRSPGSPTSCG
jgi:DNA-binding response OmpR family regulator